MRAWTVGALACVAACGGGPSASSLSAGDDASTPLDASTSGDAAPSADASGAGDAAGPADGGPTPAHAWSMGYYAGYQKGLYPVAAIEWSGLTHLAVAFYLPHTDGTIDETLSLDPTAGPQLAHDLVAAAHAHGALAIASVGGAGSGPSLQGATSGASMATFVSNLVGILTKYGYDGLDIDWEPLLASDQPAAIALAKKVRTAHPGALITMPIGIENGNFPDDLSGYPAIAAVVDQLNVMSYGMSGAYSGWNSWHSSPLYYKDSATPVSVDDTVTLYLKAGVPPQKLGIGIGFFGLCFTPPVTGPDQPLGSTTVFGDNDMSYANIMTSYYTASARKWDSLALVPYLSFPSATGPKGCTFVSYDDEQSIAEKGKYLKAKGLGGVIEWTINEGYVGGASPLLTAIAADVLH